MCGVVALWNKNDHINPESFLSSVQLLHHRGPDSQRIWISNHRKLGLGHARLSIIDLTTGMQPLHSQNGKIHAIVNGEFYDYETIRTSLINKGHVFLTHSDSEILLNLYQEYGVDCLSHLNGEFAFVLYDEERELLFAARDRFGIKPLFYSVFEGNLYIASEAKSILKLGVPSKWNEDAVWFHFLNAPSSSLTCFQGIHAVTPGHYLLASKNPASIIEKKYWDLSFPLEKNDNKILSDNEYIEQFTDLLTKAIKRRLRADVPVGCYLSGGIDSSAVSAIASELISPQKITAFTVAFEEVETLNELKFARELVETYGMHFHSFPVRMQDIVNNYAKTIWHTEWPFNNGAAVAKFLLSKYVNALNYRVVLTGEGSDELLAGYLNLWEDHIRYSKDKHDQTIYKHFQTIRKFNIGNVKLPSQLASQIIKKIGYVPAILKSAYNTSTTSFFNPDFKFHHKKQDSVLEFLNTLNIPQGIGNANTSSYMHIKSFLPVDTLNVTGDRTEMAHSIEGRPPFFDKDLVEFILTLPVHMKVRGAREKYILKEAMKNKIPDSIYKRIKHPFTAPSTHGNRETIPSSPICLYMQDIFNSGALKKVPFLNEKYIIKHFNSFIKGQENQDIGQFHLILGLCLLADAFHIKG